MGFTMTKPSHPPRVRDYDPLWLSPRQLRALNDYLITKALSRYPSDSNISDFGDYRDLYGLGPEDWGDS